MNATQIKDAILAVVAAAGAFLANALGGGSIRNRRSR